MIKETEFTQAREKAFIKRNEIDYIIRSIQVLHDITNDMSGTVPGVKDIKGEQGTRPLLSQSLYSRVE